MERLLQWGIENTDREALQSQAEAVARGEVQPRKFDAAMIDEILGKDDATRMREAMEIIQRGDDASLEERTEAFDELEMLVESIDNANNLTPLSLWSPLLTQLDGSHPTLREAACWVCGTAVQNNPTAQTAFLSHGGLEIVLTLLRADPDPAVRSKAVYCLSGELKHHPDALDRFGSLDGWATVITTLTNSHDQQPPDLPLIRKTIFLCDSLLATNPDIALPALRTAGFVRVLTELLAGKAGEDEDAAEKGVRALVAFMGAGAGKDEIAQANEALGAVRNRWPDIQIEEEEWESLRV